MNRFGWKSHTQTIRCRYALVTCFFNGSTDKVIIVFTISPCMLPSPDRNTPRNDPISITNSSFATQRQENDEEEQEERKNNGEVKEHHDTWRSQVSVVDSAFFSLHPKTIIYRSIIHVQEDRSSRSIICILTDERRSHISRVTHALFLQRERDTDSKERNSRAGG